MSKWQEEFNKRFATYLHSDDKDTVLKSIHYFIRTEIIEKLIEEIRGEKERGHHLYNKGLEEAAKRLEKWLTHESK
jgi:hypothetical protein